MFTNIYRAIVSYTNAETGDIKVRIPTKFGNDKSVLISKIGRKKIDGIWTMPEIGEQVVVTADDDSFTNVFILNVVPAALNATLDNLSNVTVPSPTSGDFLKWDGTAWVNASITTTSVPKIHVTKYTTNGNGTWTCPAGVTQIKLTLIGAGGAGGDASAEAITNYASIGISTSGQDDTAGSTTFIVSGTTYTALGGKKGVNHTVSITGNQYLSGTFNSSSTGGDGNSFRAENRYPGSGGEGFGVFATVTENFNSGLDIIRTRAEARSGRGQDGVTEVFQVTVVPSTVYSYTVGAGAGYAGTTYSTMGSNGAVIIEYVV